MKGRKNPRWKGGKNKSAWRQRVIERDNYTCQKCKINDPGVLTVDHIKNKALHKKNIYDVNNGITLCANCHLIKTKEDRELKAIFKKIAVKTVSNTLAKRYVKL